MAIKVVDMQLMVFKLGFAGIHVYDYEVIVRQESDEPFFYKSVKEIQIDHDRKQFILEV